MAKLLLPKLLFAIQRELDCGSSRDMLDQISAVRVGRGQIFFNLLHLDIVDGKFPIVFQFFRDKVK